MIEEQAELQIYSLSRVEYAIYNFFLNRLVTEQTLVYSEGQKSLAKLIDCHENSIPNAVKSLIAKGWMKRTRNGKRYSLQFTPPEHELQCRIAYCSNINFETYYDLEVRKELKRISEKLESKYENLKQEVSLLKKEELEQQSSKKTITKEHVIDFVDKLLVRLSNQFDSSSFENKVLTEIRLLKQRLASDEKESTSISKKKSEPTIGLDWNPTGINEGFEESLEFLAKNKGNK